MIWSSTGRSTGCRLERRPRASARRCGADHRHVSARSDPYRRAANSGGPSWRGAGHRLVTDPGARRLRPRPPEDRHAAAARRRDHRLGRDRNAARRRAARAVFDADGANHQSADPVWHHPDQRRHPRHHPRQCAPFADVFRPDQEPRSALLPVDRRQDRALRRARRAPDFSRAGRPRRHDRLSQRHLDLAAGGCPGRTGRDHPRT